VDKLQPSPQSETGASEPRGCPTPGSCSAAKEIAELRSDYDRCYASLNAEINESEILRDYERRVIAATGATSSEGALIVIDGLRESPRVEAALTQAAKLWSLLDDIDTMDDAAKGNDAAFRKRCYEIQRKRFQIMSGEEYDRITESQTHTTSEVK
jgi:hypothetical protein